MVKELKNMSIKKLISLRENLKQKIEKKYDSSGLVKPEYMPAYTGQENFQNLFEEEEILMNKINNELVKRSKSVN